MTTASTSLGADWSGTDHWMTWGMAWFGLGLFIASMAIRLTSSLQGILWSYFFVEPDLNNWLDGRKHHCRKNDINMPKMVFFRRLMEWHFRKSNMLGRFAYSIIKPTSWTFESCDFFCTSKASVDLWMFVKFRSRKILKLLNPPKLGAVKVICHPQNRSKFYFQKSKLKSLPHAAKSWKLNIFFLLNSNVLGWSMFWW